MEGARVEDFFDKAPVDEAPDSPFGDQALGEGAAVALDPLDVRAGVIIAGFGELGEGEDVAGSLLPIHIILPSIANMAILIE